MDVQLWPQGNRTRREFLQGTGAALAGAALVGSGRKARAEENEDKVVRIGVVGGRFGARFGWWREHPNCVVEAVSDLRPERLQHLKDTYQCDKGYESLEKLILDDDIDAVAVFTGAPDHVRHCVACMDERKHVICAVPAGCHLEECEELLDKVKETGLTYMMAETSYYRQGMISARKWWNEGRFGEVYYSESEYNHPGIEEYWIENGERTWRYGYPPMLYPTHNTAFIVGLTGERLTEVTCTGWAQEDSPFHPDNAYNNPFWNQTAFFTTNKGHAHRAQMHRYGAHRSTERAQWCGTEMTFALPHPHSVGPVIVHAGEQTERDDGGYKRSATALEPYEQTEWWRTDMLPEPLREPSGHGGSHTFLCHEFIDALVNERAPAIDIYEALAYTVPGIIAHESSLRDGERMKIPQYDEQ